MLPHNEILLFLALWHVNLSHSLVLVCLFLQPLVYNPMTIVFKLGFWCNKWSIPLSFLCLKKKIVHFMNPLLQFWCGTIAPWWYNICSSLALKYAILECFLTIFLCVKKSQPAFGCCHAILSSHFDWDNSADRIWHFSA